MFFRRPPPRPTIVELARFRSGPQPCTYLTGETASLEYRIISGITAAAYEDLLCRGWRRFGQHFFRPACAACSKCRGLRIETNAFAPDRSQLRNLARNKDVRIVVQTPCVDDARIELYNSYHAFMHSHRRWPLRVINAGEYKASFVEGAGDFAKEWLFYAEQKLVAVALVDQLPSTFSSVYFFHDPAVRGRALGVYSILSQIIAAKEQGRSHVYLGYFIQECPSMTYKAQFKPHQLIQSYIADHEQPVWIKCAGQTRAHGQNTSQQPLG